MILLPIAKGFVGGIAGTLAMRWYWKLITKAVGEDPRMRERNGEGALDDIGVIDMPVEEDESSTAAVGRMFYEAAKKRRPPQRVKRKASQVVHWSYGILQGGLYGAYLAARGRATLGRGTLWGFGMWLFGDELAVPALGLSKGPTAYPPSQHVYRLGAHLVYGATLAAVTKVLGVNEDL